VKRLALLLVLALAPVAGAYSYTEKITLHGITVRLVVMPDLGWTAYTRS
jgi:hypothetical protein